ncbi:MAG: iron complex outermembrane receptor protein [Halioglobus sp.]|jgi:iron complex outermembrane receptor protein
MGKLQLLSNSLLGAAGSVSAAFSLAVSAQGLELEEIIVTANKRESALMQTAAALSAFDSNSLEELSIQGALDLVVHTPSLSMTNNKISIRGVGRPNNALGSDPGVGVYWDGVYNTENGVFRFGNFFDIERIEVLRGPQGTLYGRNSIGGAIKLVSKQPRDEWGGEIIAEVGNYDAVTVQGLASGPVTQKLSLLLGLSSIKRDGFQENIYTGSDLEQEDARYGTIGLQYAATDDWVTTLKVVTVKTDFRPDNPYILEPFDREYVQQISDVDTGEPLNLPGMFPKQNFASMRQGLNHENPALRDENTISLDFDPYEITKSTFVALSSEYSGDNYSVKYTGGYSRYDYEYASDADGTAAENSGLDWSKLLFLGTPVSALTGYTLTPSDMVYSVDQEVSYFSHELQFISDFDGPLNFISGLYYYRSQEDQLVSFRERNDDLMAVYAFFGGILSAPVSEDNVLFRGQADLVTRSYAVYSQVNWDWTDNTVFTLGLRYSKDEKEGGDNTFVQYVGDTDDPTVFRSEQDDWSQVTWRLGVDHILNDNHFLYGFLASGYRSGGFNFQKPTSSTDVDVVDPEDLLSLEVGYKGTLLDKRLNVSAVAYYYDYKDLQVLKQDVVEGIGLNTFENADEATAWGLELESMVLLGEHIVLSGTYSYNQTEYKDFFSKDANACALGPLAEGRGQDSLCQEDLNLKGSTLPLTPQHKLSITAAYNWQWLELGWTVSSSYLYTGDQYMSAFNRDDYDLVGSWDRWDARLSTAPIEGRWQLAAYVKNISDERSVVLRARPSTVTHNATAELTQPRVYGLRLDYSF